MSRIGKLPISVPKDVDITNNGLNFIVKGKFGILETKIPEVIEIEQNDGIINVNLKNESKTIQNTILIN